VKETTQKTEIMENDDVFNEVSSKAEHHADFQGQRPTRALPPLQLLLSSRSRSCITRGTGPWALTVGISVTLIYSHRTRYGRNEGIPQDRSSLYSTGRRNNIANARSVGWEALRIRGLSCWLID
jgi:hypothetical protein